MTEKEKQEVAVFRFSIIHDFIGSNKLEYGERQRLLDEKCGKQWIVPYTSKTSIGKSTILSWVKTYLEGGSQIQSLYPKGRSDNGMARTYDSETSLALIRIRKELPTLSVLNFIKEVLARKLLPPGIELKQTTLYRLSVSTRHLNRHCLSVGCHGNFTSTTVLRIVQNSWNLPVPPSALL